MADDSIFMEGAALIECNIEILAVTHQAWSGCFDTSGNYVAPIITASEQQYLKYKAIQTGDVLSRQQLLKRVAEFIHINSLDSQPFRLSTLNRRYTRLAKKYGMTTASVVQQLLASRHIIELKQAELLALFSEPIYKYLLSEGSKHGISTEQLNLNLFTNLDGKVPTIEEIMGERPLSLAGQSPPSTAEESMTLTVPKSSTVPEVAEQT